MQSGAKGLYCVGSSDRVMMRLQGQGTAACHLRQGALVKVLTKPMKAVATPVEMAVAATTLLDGMPVFAPAEAPDKISGFRNRM